VPQRKNRSKSACTTGRLPSSCGRLAPIESWLARVGTKAAAAERNLWTVDYKNSEDLRTFLDSENTRLAVLMKDLGLAKQ
jgi:hypothetical protein